MPSMNFFGKQVEGGLYQPIPKAKLKNYGNLDPVLMKRLDRFDPGNVYGVPYMWGTTGVAYNVDKIKERMPERADRQLEDDVRSGGRSNIQGLRRCDARRR